MKVRNYTITINSKILQIFSFKDLLFLTRQDNAQWYWYIIMPLVCPSKFCISIALSSVSLGTTVISRINCKKRFTKLWGQTRHIMGDVQMANVSFVDKKIVIFHFIFILFFHYIINRKLFKVLINSYLS